MFTITISRRDIFTSATAQQAPVLLIANSVKIFHLQGAQSLSSSEDGVSSNGGVEEEKKVRWTA